MKPGDVVELKSGGPSMVVEAVTDHAVCCMWMGDTGVFEETFMKTSLRVRQIWKDKPAVAGDSYPIKPGPAVKKQGRRLKREKPKDIDLSRKPSSQRLMLAIEVSGECRLSKALGEKAGSYKYVALASIPGVYKGFHLSFTDIKSTTTRIISGNSNGLRFGMGLEFARQHGFKKAKIEMKEVMRNNFQGELL